MSHFHSQTDGGGHSELLPELPDLRVRRGIVEAHSLNPFLGALATGKLMDDSVIKLSGSCGCGQITSPQSERIMRERYSYDDLRNPAKAVAYYSVLKGEINDFLKDETTFPAVVGGLALYGSNKLGLDINNNPGLHEQYGQLIRFLRKQGYFVDHLDPVKRRRHGLPYSPHVTVGSVYPKALRHLRERVNCGEILEDILSISGSLSYIVDLDKPFANIPLDFRGGDVL
jgi:hypothetical protein